MWNFTKFGKNSHFSTSVVWKNWNSSSCGEIPCIEIWNFSTWQISSPPTCRWSRWQISGMFMFSWKNYVTGTKLCWFHKYQNHDIGHETCLCVIDSEDKFYTLKRQSVLNLRCDDKLPKTFSEICQRHFSENCQRTFLVQNTDTTPLLNCLFSSLFFSFSIDQWSWKLSDYKIDWEDRCLQTKIIGTPTCQCPHSLAKLFSHI